MWDAETVRSLGMDPGRFPPFLASGAGLGKVTAAGEAATGVPRGVDGSSPARQDYIVALLGTATVAPGRACLRAGTSEGVNVCSRGGIRRRAAHVRQPRRGRLLERLGFHLDVRQGAGVVHASASGRDASGYERLFEDVAKVAAGADRLLFLPYLAGERSPIWDPDARGAFVGLTLNHGAREMSRAVVESVAYAVRDVVGGDGGGGSAGARPADHGTAFAQPGVEPGQGGRHGPAHPRARGRGDSDLAGDACLALFGLEDFDSIAAAAESIAIMGAVFEPDPGAARVYDELFPLYRETYRGLRPVFAALAHPPG